MEVNLAEIKLKLYESIKPSGWANILKSFILSNDFDIILEKLYNEKLNKRKFTPKLNQIFRVFQETPYDQLKVLFIIKEPYIHFDIADGIAYSYSSPIKSSMPNNTKYFLKTIEDTIYPNGGFTFNTDLKRYCNQGVLMYNASLTAEMNVYGRHYEIWNPFTAFLFDRLNYLNKDLLVVFIDGSTYRWSEILNNIKNKIFLSYPTAKIGNYDNHDNWKWFCDDLFNKINKLLANRNKEQIIW